MQVSIRSATEADGEALAAIYAPAILDSPASFEEFPPDGAEMARRVAATVPTHPYLVAEAAGEGDAPDQVLGYAYASVFRARKAYERTAETSVYLAAEAQGQGLGRKLMEALLAELRERRFHRVIAGATLPNPASVALHQSLGFQFVGVFKEVGFKFGTWHDVGFWELGLD